MRRGWNHTGRGNEAASSPPLSCIFKKSWIGLPGLQKSRYQPNGSRVFVFSSLLPSNGHPDIYILIRVWNSAPDLSCHWEGLPVHPKALGDLRMFMEDSSDGLRHIDLITKKARKDESNLFGAEFRSPFSIWIPYKPHNWHNNFEYISLEKWRYFFLS